MRGGCWKGPQAAREHLQTLTSASSPADASRLPDAPPPAPSFFLPRAASKRAARLQGDARHAPRTQVASLQGMSCFIHTQDIAVEARCRRAQVKACHSALWHEAAAVTNAVPRVGALPRPAPVRATRLPTPAHTIDVARVCLPVQAATTSHTTPHHAPRRATQDDMTGLNTAKLDITRHDSSSPRISSVACRRKKKSCLCQGGRSKQGEGGRSNPQTWSC